MKRQPCLPKGGFTVNENSKMMMYLVLAFAMAWILQGITIALGQPALSTALLAVSMYAPLMAVLIVHRGLGTAKTGIGWKPRLKGHFRYYLAAWFGPAVFSAAGAALYFILFPQQFDPAMGFLLSQIPAGTALPMPMGTLMALQIAGSVIAAPLVNTIFALGEETGWRGFMTPWFCQRLGNLKGKVLSGVIWGVWHWPLIIFSGYEYGTGYAGAPWTGLPAMCLFTVVLGIALCWVYEKTDSIWAPALMHGAVNAVAGLGLYFTPAGTTHYLLGPTLAGVVAILPLALWVAVTQWKDRAGAR